MQNCNRRNEKSKRKVFDPLNAELNPICHLLALIGAPPILHIIRIKVNKRKKRKTKSWSITIKKKHTKQ
jgi:hypothetical protein